MSPQLVYNDGHGAEYFRLSSSWNISLVVNENCVQQGRNKVFSYLIERVSHGYNNAVIEHNLQHTVSSTACCLVTGGIFPKEAEIHYPSINSPSPGSIQKGFQKGSLKPRLPLRLLSAKINRSISNIAWSDLCMNVLSPLYSTDLLTLVPMTN